MDTVQAVNDMVTNLRGKYRQHMFPTTGSKAFQGTVQFGRFGNLVGAEVAAEQRITVGKTDEYELVCVRVVTVVACSGFGCVDPLTEVATRNLIFDCDHGDLTSENRADARKQAQAHAETCRAMPRPTS